jgi:hypothetical protein
LLVELYLQLRGAIKSTADMPTPGYVFRDGGTTPPAEENPDSEFRKRITKATTPVTTHAAQAGTPLAQNTTTSHALATGAIGDHEEPSAVAKAGKVTGTTNLGWQANGVGTDKLVGGLPNAELWTLVRRFNKASLRLCV